MMSTRRGGDDTRTVPSPTAVKGAKARDAMALRDPHRQTADRDGPYSGPCHAEICLALLGDWKHCRHGSGRGDDADEDRAIETLRDSAVPGSEGEAAALLDRYVEASIRLLQGRRRKHRSLTERRW